MPLTKGSTPIKPVRGCACACAIIDFAAAEADLELNLGDRQPETARRVGGSGTRQIDRKPRQQRLEQPRLMRAQLVALAPSEERAGRFWSARHCRHAGSEPGIHVYVAYQNANGRLKASMRCHLRTAKPARRNADRSVSATRA